MGEQLVENLKHQGEAFALAVVTWKAPEDVLNIILIAC